MSDGRAYFAFYRSFREALRGLPDGERLAILDALLAYAFDQTEPAPGGVVGMFFALARPILDRDWAQYRNGCKGGRKPMQNPIETQSEPALNPIIDKRERINDKREQKKDEFIAFWAAYPRKENKSAAYQEFQNAIEQGKNPDALIAAAKRYANEVRRDHIEKRYILGARRFIEDFGDTEALPVPQNNDGNPFDGLPMQEPLCPGEQ